MLPSGPMRRLFCRSTEMSEILHWNSITRPGGDPAGRVPGGGAAGRVPGGGAAGRDAGGGPAEEEEEAASRWGLREEGVGLGQKNSRRMRVSPDDHAGLTAGLAPLDVYPHLLADEAVVVEAT